MARIIMTKKKWLGKKIYINVTFSWFWYQQGVLSFSWWLVSSPFFPGYPLARSVRWGLVGWVGSGPGTVASPGGVRSMCRSGEGQCHVQLPRWVGTREAGTRETRTPAVGKGVCPLHGCEAGNDSLCLSGRNARSDQSTPEHVSVWSIPRIRLISAASETCICPRPNSRMYDPLSGGS